MNEWYRENKYHIDTFFTPIKNFIDTYNIKIKISINQLYNSFITMAYKGSIKPFKKNSYSYYNIKKSWYNNYYDTTIGSELFDLIYELKLNSQEYNKNFLDRIQTCSIQNFFETFFIDTYNHYETHNDINKLNNIDVYDEHDM